MGGATTVSCDELFTMNTATTKPMTSSTATPAMAHSHMRDPGPSGSGGSGGLPSDHGWPPY